MPSRKAGCLASREPEHPHGPPTPIVRRVRTSVQRGEVRQRSRRPPLPRSPRQVVLDRPICSSLEGGPGNVRDASRVSRQPGDPPEAHPHAQRSGRRSSRTEMRDGRASCVCAYGSSPPMTAPELSTAVVLASRQPRIPFRRRSTRSTLTCDAEVTRWLWVYGAVFLSWFPCAAGSVVRRSTGNGVADARRTAGRPWSPCRCPSNTQTLGLPRTRKAKCQDGHARRDSSC